MSNSPYGTRPAPLDVAAITAWNTANARARADYEAHPIAACAGMNQVDGERVPCEEMTEHGFICRKCERRRDEAAGRIRGHRAQKPANKVQRAAYQQAYRDRKKASK